MKRCKYSGLFIFLFVFLFTSVCLPSITTKAEPVNNFSDIQNHWAVQQISDWNNQDLVGGYADGTFKPDNSITRAEFIALVNRAFGYTEEKPVNFSDVKVSDWFNSEVAKASVVGYIAGYPDGTFNPNSPISRQEAAAVLAKVLKPKATQDKLAQFTDKTDIPSWSRTAINAIVEQGYMGGYPDHSFRALNPITRAEAIAVLDRVVGSLYNKAGVYDLAGATVSTNVTISSTDVTLKNAVISGNLYLTEGIGDGHVTLDNVQVEGDTKVSGGGENSIIIINSSLGTVIIDTAGQQNVRLVAQGSTTIGTVEAGSGAKLEEADLTGSGFEEVIIFIPEGASVELIGDFSEVNIETANANINVGQGTIGNMTLAPGTQGTNINLGAGATVNTFTTHSATQVTGAGTIQNANINASGVTLENKPTNTVLAENVEATVAGETVKGQAPAAPVMQPGSGGGGGGSKKVAVSAVNVSPETMILEVGATREITATVSPSDATNKKVNWTSSDKNIVTVDENGNVTAVAEGTVTITVTSAADSSKKAICEVKVAKDWSQLADTSWYKEEQNLFTIDTAAELAGLALLVNSKDNSQTFTGKTINLGADIDLLGLEWIPIGFINETTELTAAEYGYNNVFKGNFDGNNHTISNLKVDNGESKALGLFGVVELSGEGEIKDVKIENAAVNGYTGIGVLAGMVRAGSTWVSGIGHAAQITDIEINGAIVTGQKYVGGVIGYSTASIKNSKVSHVEVEANYKTGMPGKSGETAGGIAGNLYDNYSITGCEVENSAITSQTRAGGIAGSSRHSRDISGCNVKNVTIKLIKSEEEAAENEGYAGYISGRAEQNVINLSSGNTVTNCIAVIYGEDTEISDFCSPISTISVEPKIMTLVVTDTTLIKATVNPVNVSNKKVNWTTSSADIATVDDEGNVTAVAGGTATITATSAADSSKKAECQVTVRTVSDTADVTMGDFSVMTLSGVMGYNVGFILNDATAADVKEVVVTLYKEEQVLATNSTAGILERYATFTSLSAPFDVFGSFDYEDDGCWDYTGWDGGNADIPTKAEVKVTFKNNAIKVVTKEELAGDTDIFTKNVINMTQNKAFDTIQAAIGGVNANDTILVGEGAFAEEVHIEKPIKLIGSGIDKTTLTGTITIKADDVTVDGFTVTAPQDYKKLPVIHMIDADNVNILNNYVEANDETGQPAIGTSTGPAKVTGKIVGNTVVGAIGVGTEGQLEVVDNTVSGAKAEGIWFYPVGTEAKLTIEGNIITTVRDGCSQIKVVAKPASINKETEIAEMCRSIVSENNNSTVKFDWEDVFKVDGVGTHYDGKIYYGEFKLGYLTVADVASIELSLQKDETRQATLIATETLFETFSEANVIGGSFQESRDEYWNFTGQVGSGAEAPDKLVVKITFKNGQVVEKFAAINYEGVTREEVTNCDKLTTYQVVGDSKTEEQLGDVAGENDESIIESNVEDAEGE